MTRVLQVYTTCLRQARQEGEERRSEAGEGEGCLSGLGGARCGSTRPAEDGGPAHHERGWAFGGSGEGEIPLRQALGQAQDGVFGDGGMTGMCSVGWGNVFSFLPNVFSFWAKVFTFRPNVFTLAGEVFSEEGKSGEGREVRPERTAMCARDACADGVASCAGIDQGAGSRLRTPG